MLHVDQHLGNLLVQAGLRLVLLDHDLTLALEPSFIATLERTVCAMMAGDLEALTGGARLRSRRRGERGSGQVT